MHKGLLYAGTELAVYVSFNDGDDWQSLQLNLPATSMRDLVIHEDDAIVATHGRSFWILDDVTPLRQIDPANSEAFLFRPRVSYRVRRNENTDTPLRSRIWTGSRQGLREPPDLIERLNAIPAKGGYFFIADSTRMKRVTNNWRRKLARLLKESMVDGGHTHRFRDTAAVEWLLAGVPIESVATLLGHSLRICEGHYARWVKEIQLV